LSEMAQFDGSSWYAQGQTAVMVSLHGPTLSKNEEYDTCLVRVRVQHAKGLAPSAGGAERVVYEEMKLEMLTRTDALELTSLLESSIDAVFMRERFPRCVLAVDVVVVHDDGSLAAVALNAVMCALLDAGLPCRTTMAAVSVAAVTRAGAEQKTPSSLEFLLDPTSSEETLGTGCAVVDGRHTSGSPSLDVAEKGDLAGGVGSVMPLLSRSAAQALQAQYRCISTGVFVLSNPACGGGVLAQLVRRCGGRVDDDNGGGLSLEAYAQMLTLAERAAVVLFEFFRQCNVEA
jgi:hypothetical protein